MISVWLGVTALVLLAAAGYVAAWLLWWSPGTSMCARCGADYPRWRSRCPACRVILNEEWRATNHCERCAAGRVDHETCAR